MTFSEMKKIESGLGRLEASAENAGKKGADWWSTLLAVNETLTKCAGRGALDERLQSAASYEVCRAAIFAAWSRGSKADSLEAKTPSKLSDEPTTPTVDASGQQTFLDVSEEYR